jgi:hypothetical protein
MRMMVLGDLPGDLCTKAGQRKQKITGSIFSAILSHLAPEQRKIAAIFASRC